ncbi:TPA: YggU family protein [Methanocaldococcus jannaschii]|uniref:UPF0235 protein MJ0618 n=2 Tax=Methanocaldococcus jannaschii TaxID=2190 RepID=Y618_METJA|nr:DUF167 domain-containing protein [Methanocaldococcus jannaschii]Q58035.1 RecName: Full=UPF0235 protein MJ0618 [Methanocaldococcus jannaschii DSM 2661]AAB98613.1 conserved hypothetical protein [Methanocaldococcus jannaschii DSM 2661]HII59572.1 YggU family protein [Methanocaldococcus jannaschii]
MIEKIIKESREGVLIDIDVQANAKKNEIVGINEWRKRLSIKIKAPATEGKANKEIIKFFKEIFKKDVEIVSGKLNPQKTVLIGDIKKDEVIEILKRYL